MGPPVTRQDLQNLLAIERNRIIERSVTKQELSVLTDTIRQLVGLHQQSQQLLKQSEYQRLQLSRRAAAVEARLGSLENELKSTQILVARVLDRMAAQKLQQVPVPAPVQAAQTEGEQQPLPAQYAYRP